MLSPRNTPSRLDRRLRSPSGLGFTKSAEDPGGHGEVCRHRLNPGGDRDANASLHLSAGVWLRYCERKKTYAARRAAEGLSKREIVRSLKRYIAREVFRTLRADLAAFAA